MAAVDPRPTLQLVSLLCRDHVALADFYTAAFGFPRVAEVESPIFVALDAGSVALGFHADEAHELLAIGDRRGGVTANHVTFDVGTAKEVDAFGRSPRPTSAPSSCRDRSPPTTTLARSCSPIRRATCFRVSDTQTALAFGRPRS